MPRLIRAPLLTCAAACVLLLPIRANAHQVDARARAGQLSERADAAAAAGRLAEAVSLLEEAERLAPDWPELKVNLAAARSQAGDYEGAARAARAALALDPALDGARFNLGLALLKQGNAADAAVALAPYAGSPAPPAVHAALGLAWLRLGRAADAAPLLQKTIDAGITDRDTLLAAGRAWLDVSKPDRAVAPARLLESTHSSWIETHLLAGDVADANQDWALAANHYRRAIALDPKSAQAHYSLGLILYKQRQYDSAASEFRTALHAAPDHVSAHYYLAQLELDRGNPAAGADLLTRAAALAPARADIARDLGRALLELDRFADAVTSLRRATALAPDDPSAWFLLGRALQRNGNPEEARAAFVRATALNQQLRDRLQKQVSGTKRSGG
jgi:Flp pilus assembly protein TadD